MYRVYPFFALVLWFALVACQLQPTPTPPRPTLTPAASPTSPPLPTPTPTEPPVSIPIVVHLADEINPNEVSQEATLIWYFNQPMNEKSTLTPVRFTPPLAGTFTWSAEGMVLTFTPAGVLPAGKQITATLSRQLTTWDGQQMATTATLEWVLQVKNQPLPLVKIVSRPSSTHRSAPFTVAFNYPLDEVSVLSAVELTPDVEGSWRWEAITKQLTFTPSTVWPSATPFTITFSTPLVNVEGETVGLPAVVTIAPLTALTAVAPQSQTTSMPQAIIVTFDQPLSSLVLTNSLQIDPPLLGTLTVLGNQLVYTITENMPYNTPYVVTLQPTITTAEGKPALPSVYSWSFTTPVFQLETPFGQGEKWQVITAVGPRHFEFVTNRPQVTEVQFKAYQYPIQQFVAQTPFSNTISGYPFYYTLYFFDNTPSQARQYFPTAGLPLAHQWSISTTTTYTKPYQYEVWNEGIQVIEPFTGFPQQTSLPADLPAGVYVLEMSISGVETPPAQLLLFVTNYKVLAKQGIFHLWLWASDSSNQPASALPVQIYNQSGVSFAQGVTDEQGMFEIPVPLTGDEPAYALVGRGEDVVIVPLGYIYERNQVQEDPQGYFVRLLVKLDFNRFQYQPGDAFYYQAWVREEVNGQIQLPPAGLTMTLTDKLDTPRLLNEFGTVTGQVAPTITFEAGYEMLVLGSDGYKDGYDVTFFYLQPPAQPYTLTVTPSQLRPVVGQTITLTFQAFDAAAQPLSQTKVKACLSPTPPEILWDIVYEGTLSDPLAEKSCYEGVTSAAGQWELELPVEANETNFSDEFIHPQLTFSRWLVEASLQLTPTTPITIYSGFSAYNSAEWLSLEPPITVVPVQQPFTPSITLLNLQNEPVPGRVLQASLWQFAGEEATPKLVFEQESVTNSQGQLVMPLTITTAGHYTLTVTGEDSWGNLFTAEQIIFAPGTAAVDTPTFAPLEMTAIKNRYQIGDVVQLFVETAYSGPAVLTLEREQVERAILVELNAPFTILELPLEPADFPNIRVSLTHWATQDTTLRPPHYYSLNNFYPVSTSFYLTVIDPQKLLDVTLTPDKPTYAPGELATITIQVSDQQGQPAAAEVSLTLTDELSYVLYPQFKRSLYNTFYGGRVVSVNTTHTHLFQRLLVTYGRVCCHPYSPDVRYGYPAYFEDNEIWLPNLRTDEKGQITVQVTMPNSTGNWRLTGRAITQTTQVGQTTVAISTQP